MGQFFGGSEEDLDADGGGGEVFDHVEGDLTHVSYKRFPSVAVLPNLYTVIDG